MAKPHNRRRRSAFLLLVLVTGLLSWLAPARLQAEEPGLRPRIFLPAVSKFRSAVAGAPYYAGEFGYGLHLAATDHLRLVVDLGFGYVKFYVPWARYEPQKGGYIWNSGRESIWYMAQEAATRGLRVIIRVDNPPAWAAPGSGNRPPTDPADFGDFMAAYAQYMQGMVAAYEIYNEPNLALEWGNQPPSPERYTQLLRAAYPRIKAADPQVVVISAGLAPTSGDGGTLALDDLQFLDRMYRAGARPYFDALGSHPYGFGSSPETRSPTGFDFHRAADHYAVMLRHGDGGKKVWATEFGWILDPGSYGHPEYVSDPSWFHHRSFRVDPQTQADYLVRAYRYAYANWPWMAVMVAFNLDFSTQAYYPPAEPMRWYSILNLDLTPRPAYSALQAMPKPFQR